MNKNVIIAFIIGIFTGVIFMGLAGGSQYEGKSAQQWAEQYNNVFLGSQNGLDSLNTKHQNLVNCLIPLYKINSVFDSNYQFAKKSDVADCVARYQ